MAKHTRIGNIEEKPQEEKKKNKVLSAIGTFFKILLLIVLLGILVIMILYVYELVKSGGDGKKAAVGVLKKVADTIVEAEPANVLLLGYSTDQGTTLTDTIILAGYNPDTQKAYMVSIPRDTFVGNNLLHAEGTDKINSLYSTEKPYKIVDAVEDLTGVDIDYYVTINTDSLIKMVDILGGVEFDVPINMNYDDPTQNLHIHLDAGLQMIDGEKAEQLLRFRKNNNNTTYSSEYGSDDYGRMKTQRDFIMAVVSQSLSTNDLNTMKELISTVFDNFETDCPMSVIFSYLVYAYDFDMDNIETAQLPRNFGSR